MKFFICALDGICLGIPAEQTEKLISAPQSPADTEVLISLPNVFHLKNTDAPHGIVLKSDGPVTTVLLTPKIDIELEIPDENIFPLPQALMGQLQYFTGACFSDHTLILILNTVKLMEMP
ncbi:MAG: hypothetical protein FWG89_10380 [Treponema sp.]|nr:hypothetical protein [Treponema sp.]